MMGIVLKKAGCPLDDAQIEQIKNLERGPDSREQFMSILTGEQKEALENHFTAGDSEKNVLQKPVAQNEQPETFNVLKQNYPNPFNPATTIDYQLAKAGNVTVEIYGPNGQLVSTLVNDFQNTGWHSVTWNASAHAGGIYVCRITSVDFTESRKMTYVK